MSQRDFLTAMTHLGFHAGTLAARGNQYQALNALHELLDQFEQAVTFPSQGAGHTTHNAAFTAPAYVVQTALPTPWSAVPSQPHQVPSQRAHFGDPVVQEAFNAQIPADVAPRDNPLSPKSRDHGK